MPAKSPAINQAVSDLLLSLGQKIRDRRKELRLSAVVVAETARISRVTLHRIEKGQPSVTMGAWLGVLEALGLRLDLSRATQRTAGPADDRPAREGWIPARIRLDDYPQLKLLAWQLQGTEEISPVAAWSIYERNWRHLDLPSLQPAERQLIEALRIGLGGGVANV